MIQFKRSHITVFESALYRTTSSVVETPDLVLVVDPNWLPEEVATIRTYVNNIREQRPVFLLFTHSDYDHILGYGAFPDAKVIASQALAENPNASTVVEEIHQFDDEHYIERAYPLIYPKVDYVANADDWSLQVGATRLTGWMAPGHNQDGMFLLVEPGGVFLVGDYLCNVEFPFVYHSSSDYLATLDKAAQVMEDHRPSLLVPGHGDLTEDPGEMRKRLEDSRSYLLTLRHCVAEDRECPEDHFLKGYRFSRGLRGEHRKNVEFIRKELMHQGPSKR